MEVLPSLLAWQGAPPKGAAAARTTLFSGRESRAPIVSVTWGYSFDLAEKGHELAAMHSGDYKLILDVANAQTRLFNLAKDPSEKHDLSRAMPEKTRNLNNELLALRKKSLAAGARQKTHNGTSAHLKKQLKTLGYTH